MILEDPITRITFKIILPPGRSGSAFHNRNIGKPPKLNHKIILLAQRPPGAESKKLCWNHPVRESGDQPAAGGVENA